MKWRNFVKHFQSNVVAKKRLFQTIKSYQRLDTGKRLTVRAEGISPLEEENSAFEWNLQERLQTVQRWFRDTYTELSKLFSTLKPKTFHDVLDITQNI